MSYQVNVNPRIVAITNEPGLIAGIPGYVKIYNLINLYGIK
jgi:hypothetical protein